MFPDIDECAAPSPCVFGDCFDAVNDYNCICTAGYTGKNCDGMFYFEHGNYFHLNDSLTHNCVQICVRWLYDHKPATAWQTRDVVAVLVEFWASVADCRPTFNQHWDNVSCFLGVTGTETVIEKCCFMHGPAKISLNIRFIFS